MAQVTQIKPAALETTFAPILKAIAISSDNTDTSKTANTTAIAAYITSLKNLGVDVTSGFAAIPIMLDSEYAGYIQQVNASANWYAGVLKGGSQINILDGEVTVKDLCYNEPSGLTTTAKTVAGAINELNAKAGDAVHNAGETYSDTLPDGVTADEPFSIREITIGKWNNNTYKAQILTGINTSDHTIKQFQRTTADNGANWTAWTTL